MNLEGKAKQVEFAELVGISQPAVSKLIEKEILEEGATYLTWLQAYCYRLREEASGRVKSDARERRDMAQAEESEINAAMKRRQMLKEEAILLYRDDVTRTLTEWSILAKHEMAKIVDKLVTAIESQHGITVDGDLTQQLLENAGRAMASHRIEYRDAGRGDRDRDLDPAA